MKAIFLELTTEQNDWLLVNINKINYVKKLHNDKCQINFENGSELVVNEDFEDVKDWLESPPKNSPNRTEA